MQPSLITETIAAISPHPSVGPEGGLFDGLVRRQAQTCRQCSDRQCAAGHVNPRADLVSEGVCHRGQGVVRVQLERGTAVLVGVVTPGLLATLSDRERRQRQKEVVTLAGVERWRVVANAVVRRLQNVAEQETGDTLGMFHDVQASVSTLVRSAEAMVDKQKGATFEEKLEALPIEAVSVVKAVQLLHRRMALMPLLTNPDAAKYGQKHPTPVYRLCDLVVRATKPFADREGKRLSLSGSSFKKPMAYDSLEVIPLVLIDNAIKYSHAGQSIEVLVTDTRGGVNVEVHSFSVYLTPEERGELFQRGRRAVNAKAVAARGAGLGLYLAQTVARAHGFTIAHSADDKCVMIGSVGYANNVFSFCVPD